MILDASGRPAAPTQPDDQTPADDRGTARAFFATASRAATAALKSETLTARRVRDLRAAEAVGDLYAGLLSGLDDQGREEPLLRGMVSDRDALAACRLLAQAHESAVRNGVTGPMRDAAVERVRALDAVDKLVRDADLAPRAGVADDPATTRARALLLWATLARGLVVEVVSRPGAPATVAHELVWLTTEAQLLAAAALGE